MTKDAPAVGMKTTIGKSSFTLTNKNADCPFSAYSYLSPIEN
jgi:hypothetical protein